MSNWPAIRQNSDLAKIGTEEPAGANGPAVPGKWRRLTMRLGAFEIGYASVRIDRPALQKDPRYLPAPRRRGGFSGRFIEHLGFTMAALAFLGGAVSLLAMQSDAFVSHSANHWPIVDGGSSEADIKAGTAQAAAPFAAAGAPTPVPVAVTLQPSIIRAAIRDSIADLVRKGDIQGQTQLAPLVQEANGAERAAAMKGPLDRVPAVAAAIKRAMATGEVQNWAAGNYEGVVVVGDSYQADGGAVCREGSILARDGGPANRTQSFERCTKAASGPDPAR